MTILATLTFKISKGGAGGGFDAGQYQTGGGIGTGGGSGYTPGGSPFFPPSVASPYFVPTPVYGPAGTPTTPGVGVIIKAKDPQGSIMKVDHPLTAIPGASFNLITRFTHKHSGSAAYSIRVRFPQIMIDSTSPPSTISQNGIGVIISTITVPGESATSPIPAILTGTIELIRTQIAGTSNGITVEAAQVIDDARVVTITKLGAVLPPTVCPAGHKPNNCNCLCIPNDTVEAAVVCPPEQRCPRPGVPPIPIPIPGQTSCVHRAHLHCLPLRSGHGRYEQCMPATIRACQAGSPLPPLSSFPGRPQPPPVVIPIPPRPAPRPIGPCSEAEKIIIKKWKELADKFAKERNAKCPGSGLGGQIQCKAATNIAASWLANYQRARAGCTG